MKNILLVFVVAVVVMTTACSHLMSQAETPIAVELPDRTIVSFTGKGAGAGMMLMSSMGPMGIAIGVAIDEGIAKDINQALVEHGFDIEREVIDALRHEMRKGKFKHLQSSSPVLVTIRKYGFKTYPGEGDLVSAWLELVIDFNGKKIDYTFPTNEQTKGQSILTLALGLAKSDGKAGARLLRKATALAASYWVGHFSD